MRCDLRDPWQTGFLAIQFLQYFYQFPSPVVPLLVWWCGGLCWNLLREDAMVVEGCCWEILLFLFCDEFSVVVPRGSSRSFQSFLPVSDAARDDDDHSTFNKKARTKFSLLNPLHSPWHEARSCQIALNFWLENNSSYFLLFPLSLAL